MRIPLLATALFLPLPAVAADVRGDLQAVEAAYAACSDAAVAEVEMRDCAGNAFDDADGLLNRAYKAIVAELSTPAEDEYDAESKTETLARLKAAQRAWIGWRDAGCSLVSAQMLGGTGENTLYAGCLVEQTIDRIKGLEDQFHPLDQ